MVNDNLFQLLHNNFGIGSFSANGNNIFFVSYHVLTNLFLNIDKFITVGFNIRFYHLVNSDLFNDRTGQR